MNIHELNTKAITNPAYVALDDGSDTYKLDLNAKLSTMQNSISGAESDIVTAQGDITLLQTNMSQAQGAIFSAQGEIEDLQSNLNALSTQTSASIGNLQTELDAAEDDVTDLNEAIGQTNYAISDLGLPYIAYSNEPYIYEDGKLSFKTKSSIFNYAWFNRRKATFSQPNSPAGSWILLIEYENGVLLANMGTSNGYYISYDLSTMMAITLNLPMLGYAVTAEVTDNGFTLTANGTTKSYTKDSFTNVTDTFVAYRLGYGRQKEYYDQPCPIQFDVQYFVPESEANDIYYNDNTRFDAVKVLENVSLPNPGWIGTNGVIHPIVREDQWIYSDKVATYEGQRVDYYCFGQQNVGTIIFFDTNDAILSYITYTPTGSEIQGILQGSVNAPSGVSYLRACTWQPDLPGWYVKMQDGANLPSTLDILANRTLSKPWEGKTIDALGDSITYGAGLSSPTTQRWTTILASLSGALVNNYGVSGSKISDISGDSTPSFIDRYQSMANADLVIIFGGTNDYWHGVTNIGTMGSTDVSTYYGALSTILENLVKKSPLTQVVFVFPYQQKFGNNNSREDKGHGTFEDFRNATKEMCEYYSVPMLDLFNNSGFDVIDSTVQYSTMTIDGVHPTVTGQNYLARRINNFINDIEPLT